MLQALVTTLSLSTTRMTSVTALSSALSSSPRDFDPKYPGTAVARMKFIRTRVMALSAEQLNGPWQNVRREILKAGGLKDLPHARPGKGCTGHSFNDYNHCDLTAMAGAVSNNENDGRVKDIARGNLLGPGIAIASLQEEDGFPPGGSWSTCINGCNTEPPSDVAHLQFQSRIAFKLVWYVLCTFKTLIE